MLVQDLRLMWRPCPFGMHSWVSSFIVSIAICLFHVDIGFAQSDPIRDYFQGKIQERREIKSLSVEWEREVVLDLSSSGTGLKERFLTIFDHANDRYRVELERSQDGQNTKSRFAFSNDVFRIIPDERLAGYEYNSLDSEYLRNGKINAAFDLSADPRIFGLIPESFGIVRHFEIDDINILARQAPSVESKTIAVKGSPQERITFHGFKGRELVATYFLSPEQGNYPVKLVLRTPSTKTTIKTSWKRISHADDSSQHSWMPSSIEIKERRNDELVLHEQVKLLSIAIGKPIPTTLFEWETMRVPDDYPIERRSGTPESFTATRMQWDKKEQKFKKKPKPDSLEKFSKP
ncbi:hypothetical protein [Bremerella sp.]|uniref:hypothetical protein n=1 Tax=Bremerella sp. TaxID=2795602 RepID=UPI00391D25A1